MDFLYQISPATWLKIGLCSLLLGGTSTWFLFGAQLGLPVLTINLSNRPTNNTVTPPDPNLPVPQVHAIAPEGILDQYVEFAELLSFIDTEFQPDFVLPPAIAPIGILDPAWTGAAP